MNSRTGTTARTARSPRHAVAALLALSVVTVAMTPRADAQAAKDSAGSKEEKVPRLFRSEEPVTVTFTTNIRQIRRDKSAEAPWRWGALTYQDSAGKPAQVPVRVRTRGIWRLKNCSFPPIRLNFSKKTADHTLFDGLDEPKLVNYCQDNEQHERYILQEYQLYRVYQTLTPVSHRVRLLRMAYVDSASGKREAERYAFIVEDPAHLAKRLSAKLLKQTGATPADLDGEQLALAYLFEYFIGNLDFSWSGLHNTELLGTADGRVLPVAYDFDYAGAVNAWYAAPPPNYGVSNVRTRKFMAPCELQAAFPGALTRFIEKKDAIYALYRDPVGALLPPKLVKETLEYFDDFYDKVRTPQDAKKNVFDRCIRA